MKRLLPLLLILPLIASAQEAFPPESSSGAAAEILCLHAPLAVATTGTSEEILATCTIPANSLGTTTKYGGIYAEAHWQGAANVNAKRIRIRVGGIGGQGVVDLTDSTSNNRLQGRASLMMSSSTALEGWGSWTREVGSSGVYALNVEATGLTFTSAITVVATGETSVQAGDLTLTSFTVRLLRR